MSEILSCIEVKTMQQKKVLLAFAKDRWPASYRLLYHVSPDTVWENGIKDVHIFMAIASGDVVGWFQGAMEWGPRALGNRSFLADPRNDSIREELNRKISIDI